MGCCFSSTSTATATKPHDPPCQTSLKRHHSPLQPPILHSHKTPSPPQVNDDEEEAVIKEVLVLSETPKPAHENQQENITQTPPVLPPPSPPKTETQVSRPVKQQQQQEQEQEQEASHISQQSEVYSVSETITTTTTTTMTATECFKEDEATSKDNSQLKHKSPEKGIKKRPNNGDPPGVRARRESARGRGRGPRTVQRNVGSRSRSPGTGRAGGVSNGAVGKSPATVTGKTDKKIASRASATVEGQGKREEDEKNEVSEQQQGAESIENPHVSLECFIFL